jgi:hypothetical protein
MFENQKIRLNPDLNRRQYRHDLANSSRIGTKLTPTIQMHAPSNKPSSSYLLTRVYAHCMSNVRVWAFFVRRFSNAILKKVDTGLKSESRCNPVFKYELAISQGPGISISIRYRWYMVPEWWMSSECISMSNRNPRISQPISTIFSAFEFQHNWVVA